jgi:hypothetical protein
VYADLPCTFKVAAATVAVRLEANNNSGDKRERQTAAAQRDGGGWCVVVVVVVVCVSESSTRMRRIHLIVTLRYENSQSSRTNNLANSIVNLEARGMGSVTAVM